jgi:hypothetical protein
MEDSAKQKSGNGEDKARNGDKLKGVGFLHGELRLNLSVVLLNPLTPKLPSGKLISYNSNLSCARLSCVLSLYGAQTARDARVCI